MGCPGEAVQRRAGWAYVTGLTVEPTLLLKSTNRRQREALGMAGLALTAESPVGATLFPLQVVLCLWLLGTLSDRHQCWMWNTET